MYPHGARGFRFSFPPVPREVRLKPGAVVGVWVPRVAVLPFILAGLFALLATLKSPLTFALGSNTAGRVTQVTPHWSRGRVGRHLEPQRFDLVFTYQLPGDAPQTGDGVIDTAGAKPPTVGQPVPIRVLRIGDVHLTELPSGNSGVSGSCCVMLFMLVWCGFVTLFAAAAWMGPVAARALVRDGTAVAGTVVGKRKRTTGKSRGYDIVYQFTTAEGTAESAVQWVSNTAGNGYSEGQAVTVLYDPRRPSRSTIYEASDYEVSR